MISIDHRLAVVDMNGSPERRCAHEDRYPQRRLKTRRFGTGR
jgi:hypothetical protein